MLRRTDLLWMLAYPLYRLFGTLRHEGSHALVAVLEGAHIEEFVFWPTVRVTSGLSWGYVAWNGHVSWVATAAPYLCDVFTFALFFGNCMEGSFSRRWVWLHVITVGLVSPFVNSLSDYWGRHPSNEVGGLLLCFQALPLTAGF